MIQLEAGHPEYLLEGADPHFLLTQGKETTRRQINKLGVELEDLDQL